jgi:DNA-binding NarL/FixJ family response regulator
VCEHIDAPAAAEDAVDVLRRLGERVEVAPRRSGPLEVLSPREREVFDLVAQGLSNPAIARRLFVTPKTAEHHVGSILGKLGLRSRAEVAAYAVTLGSRELVAG